MGASWIVLWRVVGVRAIVVWSLALASGTVEGDVALMLLPTLPMVTRGEMVEIGLYAVSDDGVDQTVAAMDVLLTWDPEFLRFEDFIDNGPTRWLMSGFLGDSALDGLNDSLLDGDGMYTALSGLASPAVATSEGFLVSTFRFKALKATSSTELGIESSLGDYSITRVFGGDFTNQVVTGDLFGTSVEVLPAAGITAPDLSVPRGGVTDLVVFGDILNLSTFGVAVVMEIVPEKDAVGVVEFTDFVSVDIVQLDDPWPNAGLFMPFDTDQSLSSSLNGMVDDNGTFLAAPTTFEGPLAAFPVWVDEDADGVWQIQLSVPASTSGWEGLPTVLETGFLRPVDPGDGNGDGAVDMLSVAEFQRCFTGDQGGDIGRPAFELTPQLHCAVYDMDSDRDVDLDDFGLLRDLITGPGA